MTFHRHRNCVLVLSMLLGICLSETYVPGTPGGSWTAEEVLIVKAKLFAIFNNQGGKRALEQIYGKGNDPSTWQDVPNAAKVLRLGFHDCLK